ncbi:hypothetical protein M3Y94_00087500 [Aphelenchoides besseyi]|nr:hypothetical protein M3Y94_00087500 [Aphelenchoides besseyi]
MSKSMGSGAAWMLILLIATTMFAIAGSSLLSSDEKGFNCFNGRRFEGACNGLNVDVTSKSGTIKATMDIKKRNWRIQRLYHYRQLQNFG